MVKELKDLIGKRAMWRLKQYGINVGVKILDVRMSYGQIQYFITPIDGTGSRWTENLTEITDVL